MKKIAIGVFAGIGIAYTALFGLLVGWSAWTRRKIRLAQERGRQL